MKVFEIYVENIKDCGCMNRIKTALQEMNGIHTVEVNLEMGMVSVSGTDLQKECILQKLVALGFPEKGNNNIIRIAESFRSCVLGRKDL